MTVVHPVRPAAAPPVGPADVARGPRAAGRCRRGHADGECPGAERAVCRAGAVEVREPAAHRLVQDPRRLHADRPARRRAAGARGRRRQRRQPRAGGRARRAAARRLGDGVHAGRAALPKVAATRGYGATVHLVGATVDESLDAAHEFAERTGAVLVHPFDHVDVIAGQGTVGLEILEQCPDVATVLVPLGGGGLLGGIAAAVARRGCGWSACRPPARRRGRRRWRRAGADRAADDAHHRRRHRGRAGPAT